MSKDDEKMDLKRDFEEKKEKLLELIKRQQEKKVQNEEKVIA
jgi:hypothetical protein